MAVKYQGINCFFTQFETDGTTSIMELIHVGVDVTVSSKKYQSASVRVTGRGGPGRPGRASRLLHCVQITFCV
jgi:hypothetical protein